MLGTGPSLLTQRPPTGFRQAVCYPDRFPGDAETRVTQRCLLSSLATPESCSRSTREPFIDRTTSKPQPNWIAWDKNELQDHNIVLAPKVSTHVL